MSAAAAIGAAPAEHARWILRIADTSLVLAQRLGEGVGHAPSLEEDMALANIGLDLLGQARLLLAHAGELEGAGRDEDALAFLRDPSDYFNLALAEQPNGDFAHVIVRGLLIALWQRELYGALTGSTDQRLAEIAAKAVKETRYHARYAGGWFVRLGDGTEESNRRMQTALDSLWRFTPELFEPDALDAAMAAAGVAPVLEELKPAWSAAVDEHVAESTLRPPQDEPYPWFGKRGEHGEAFGRLLAEMQFLQRAYPGARW